MATIEQLRHDPGGDVPTFDSLDPGTGAVVGTYPVDDAAAVAAAVERARAASVWWRSLGFTGRAIHLRRFKAEIARRMDELADLVHRENGKPHADAVLEITLVVDHLTWASAPRPSGARPPPGLPGTDGAQQHGHRRVPAARRRRRHRPVELPRLHADGLDRLRPGRGQRGGLQAQ